MAQGMGSVGLGLGGTVGKFKKVMDDPQGRRTVYTALGITMALFLLYLWWRLRKKKKNPNIDANRL